MLVHRRWLFGYCVLNGFGVSFRTTMKVTKAKGSGRDKSTSAEQPTQAPHCCLCPNLLHLLFLALSPQIEFDPSLDVDVVHAPVGWRAPDLFITGPDFLDAMRPLLDTYLEAQGEQPLQDMEWQVRRLCHRCSQGRSCSTMEPAGQQSAGDVGCSRNRSSCLLIGVVLKAALRVYSGS